MVEWYDKAILLGTIRYGEHGLRLTFLCAEQGKQSGFIKHIGKSVPQIGNIFDIRWRARLQEQLGQLRLLPHTEIFAHIAPQPSSLILMQATTSLLYNIIAERDPYPELYIKTEQLLQIFCHYANHPNIVTACYCLWEKEALQHVGMGLDWSQCALTGAQSELAFVSPNTGRAVTQAAVNQARANSNAEKWVDKLLSLPDFLQTSYADGYRNPSIFADVSIEDLQQSLSLTQFFLEKYINSLQSQYQKIPEIRKSLSQQLTQQLSYNRLVAS